MKLKRKVNGPLTAPVTRAVQTLSINEQIMHGASIAASAAGVIPPRAPGALPPTRIGEPGPCEALLKRSRSGLARPPGNRSVNAVRSGGVNWSRI